MKTHIKLIFISALIILLSQKTFSQDTSKVTAIKAAFESSYIYEKGAQYQLAINKLKAVYDANSYELNLRLGYVCYEAALYREAERYYKKAIDLKPNSIEAKLGLVYPLAALTSWDTVRMQYEAIIKIDPNNSTANYRLGLVYYYKADYKTALPYFEKVNTLYPFDYDNNLMYAWTNLKLGNKVLAKTLFNTALMYKPNDASAMEGLKAIK
jgi:tetratricopeptide (TPR) repeat protein